MLLKRLRNKVNGPHKEEDPDVEAVEVVDPPASDELTPILISSDASVEDNRTYSQASSGLIHVSSLQGLCPRAYVLAVDYQSVSSLFKPVSSNDRIVWAMGRAAEAHVRDAIINAISPQRVVGVWRCPCDNHEEAYEDFSETGFKECECGAQLVDRYQEVPLVDMERGIIGNCDLPYFGPKGKLVPTEIKSVKGEFFKEMKGRELGCMPTSFLSTMVENHVFQVAAYHRLLEYLGYPMADHCRLIYASKNYLGMRRGDVPYLEYVVDMVGAVNARLDREWEKAELIQWHRERGSLPPRLEPCTRPESLCAAKCPMVASCFMTRR